MNFCLFSFKSFPFESIKNKFVTHLSISQLKISIQITKQIASKFTSQCVSKFYLGINTYKWAGIKIKNSNKEYSSWIVKLN